MTAAPPDPRGVAGLVGDAALEAALAAFYGDAGWKFGQPVSDVAFVQDKMRAALTAALAASPVSQPTVGGAYAQALATHLCQLVSGDARVVAEKLAHTLGATIPASVEPVSQDAEDAARFRFLMAEFAEHGCFIARTYGPGKHGCEFLTVSAQHIRGLGLRQAVDRSITAAARQEKGR